MLAALAAAAQFFWTDAGPNANWSTGANWSGGVAPPSSPSTQLDFGGLLAPLTTFVDAPWTVNRLTFNSASLSPAFVLASAASPWRPRRGHAARLEPGADLVGMGVDAARRDAGRDGYAFHAPLRHHPRSPTHPRRAP
jgi:hypothetical protein